jgi:hypothetical protein
VNFFPSLLSVTERQATTGIIYQRNVLVKTGISYDCEKYNKATHNIAVKRLLKNKAERHKVRKMLEAS